MILPAALCLSLMTAPSAHSQLMVRSDLPMEHNSETRLWYVEQRDPLDPAKKSPKLFGESKIPWEFDWLIGGNASIMGDTSNIFLRFRVYSQEHHEVGDKSPLVARMLLRLWDFNIKRLRYAHNPEYHRGLVDVFLCFGGKAGGEQLIDVDLVPDPKNSGQNLAYKDNTIYIYDMPSFTDPVEMAREIAHEYGHATLPPVGGYKEPEDWADGYLSEKIYLRWMRDAMARGVLAPVDAMGATKEGLDKWVTANVDPVELKAAQTEPTDAVMGDKSADGMAAFIGLAVYVEDLFPDLVFSQSLRLVENYDPKTYPAAIVLAAGKPLTVTLKIPPKLVGKPIWLPLGGGKLFGAKILKTNKIGWVQAISGTGPVVITNPP